MFWVKTCNVQKYCFYHISAFSNISWLKWLLSQLRNLCWLTPLLPLNPINTCPYCKQKFNINSFSCHPLAYLAYLCLLPQHSNCHSSISYTLGNTIKLQRRLQQNIPHCRASKPDLKKKKKAQYIYRYMEFLFTHERLCHDDANLAFSQSSEVNKQALQDIFSWFTVGVNADGQHGWRSFFSLCTRNRRDRWLDISVTNWRSWKGEETHLLLGKHLNSSLHCQSQIGD